MQCLLFLSYVCASVCSCGIMYASMLRSLNVREAEVTQKWGIFRQSDGPTRDET